MKNLYVFDSQYKLIGTISQKNLLRLDRKEEIRDNELPLDIFTAEFKWDAFKNFEDIYYFAVKSLNDENAFHFYFVQNHERNTKTVILHGTQLAYRELDKQIKTDIRPSGNAKSVMTSIVNGTGWRVGFASDTQTSSFFFYYVSALEALKEVSVKFNLQLEFKVEISGQRISDKWIEAHKIGEKRSMKRFTHKHNALEIVQKLDRTELVTALIGLGKGEKVGDGYGRSITFADIERSIAEGYEFDKPKGQVYVEDKNATQLYGIKNPDGTMSPAIGIIKFDEVNSNGVIEKLEKDKIAAMDLAETEEEKKQIEAEYDKVILQEYKVGLLNDTWEQLKFLNRDKIEFSSTVADFGECEIAEVVSIHNFDQNIHYETNIFEKNTNFLAPFKSQIRLGDKIIMSRAEKNAQAKRQTLDLIKDAKDEIIQETITLTSADGKNVINYTDTEPTQKRVGDSWVRQHPAYPEHTQWLIWDGNAWDIIMDSSEEEQLQKKIEANTQLVNEAKSAADKAVEKNKVFEQINQQAGNVLIRAEEGGARFNITKDNVFMDNAVISQANIDKSTITDALLENVTFDWAKGKTLDAEEINVININGSSLTFDKVFTNEFNASGIGADIDLSSNRSINLTVKNTTQSYIDENKDQLKGDKGEKGDKGDKGDKGERGLQGLQGPTGEQGIPGKNGKDGTSSYTHIAYANSADGSTGFSVSDSTNKLYIGMYVDENKEDSDDPKKYKWTLIKGQDGKNGTPGAKGADGKTPYLHIAYSNSADGKKDFSISDSNRSYIGQYTNYEKEDSTDPKKYTWSKIQGEDGADGAPGKDGIGITSTTIEYAVNQSGTTKPTSGWSETVPKTNPGDYLWTKTTWKYTDNTSEDSYSVGRIGANGADGNDGLPGAPGVGIKKTTITYAKSTSGTVIPPSIATWSPSPPAGNPGEFIWTKTVWTYTNNETEEGYSVGMIGKTGAQGAKGAKGDTGPQGPKGEKGDTGEADYTKFRTEYETELNVLQGKIDSKVAINTYNDNNKLVNEKFTQIEQTTEEITSTVVESNNTLSENTLNALSELNQSLNGLTSEEDVQKLIDELNSKINQNKLEITQTNDSFTQEYSRIEASIENNRAELEKLSGVIKSGLDEDGNTYTDWIGDDENRVRVGSDGIVMLSNNTETLKLKDGRGYMNSLYVEHELGLGNHTARKVGTEFTVFMPIGGQK